MKYEVSLNGGWGHWGVTDYIYGSIETHTSSWLSPVAEDKIEERKFGSTHCLCHFFGHYLQNPQAKTQFWKKNFKILGFKN